tara:strand:- start:945 stop:1379 length:435 start_codon:yes stop_codon:yes gene_type:complete
MIIQREVFIPSVEDREEKNLIYFHIDKIDTRYKITIDNGSPIEYKTYREVWDFIDRSYNLCVKNDTAIIIIENETNTRLSFGLGKGIILDKFDRIDIRERQIKRMSNIKRKMVVDTPYKSSKKKIDMRVFDRKRYASSNSRGIG